jgi:hypothetical protein
MEGIRNSYRISGKDTLGNFSFRRSGRRYTDIGEAEFELAENRMR